MPSVSNNKRRLLTDRAGVTSLEWAMVAVAFMFLMISVFDLVRYVVILQSVASVMTEAGRACLINPGVAFCSGGNTSSWSTLSTVAPMLDSSQFSVNVVTGSDASGSPYGSVTALGMNVIQVTVSYPFVASVPWTSSLNATITETATYFN